MDLFGKLSVRKTFNSLRFPQDKNDAADDHENEAQSS